MTKNSGNNTTYVTDGRTVIDQTKGRIVQERPGSPVTGGRTLPSQKPAQELAPQRPLAPKPMPTRNN